MLFYGWTRISGVSLVVSTPVTAGTTVYWIWMQKISGRVVAAIIALFFCVEPASADRTFTWQGFAEFENYFSADPDTEFSDAGVKHELRVKLLTRYGTESVYVYAAPDLYLTSSSAGYDYSDNSDETRTLKLSSSGAELVLNEFYGHYGAETWQARAGNQVIVWGTADVFNPTSYFNPRDLREIVFRGEDENRTGIPAVSAMSFGDSYAVHFVFAPVHVPVSMAEKNGFWAASLDNFSIPVYFSPENSLDISPEHFGYGARFSFTSGSLDASVSGYYGPDNEQVFVPKETVVSPSAPLALLVEPRYYMTGKLGVDASISFDSLVVQCEASWAPDRRSPVIQDTGDPGSVVLPYSVKKTGALSWSAGFNYYIPLYRLIDGHDGESVLTAEWFQTHYFDDSVMPPVISDIATLRYDDSFLSGRLRTTLTAMMDTRYSGAMIWPKISYDVMADVSLTLSYAWFEGRTEDLNEVRSLFYYYRENDIVEISLRYDF